MLDYMGARWLGGRIAAREPGHSPSQTWYAPLFPCTLRLTCGSPDIAYTALPQSSVLIGGYWVPFWTLAKLSFPSRRTDALAERPPQTPAPGSNVQLDPDERLLCFDFMYYIGAQDHDEWWEEWSPAWIEVGRHARWEKRLERVAVGYIQRALGVEEGEEVPRVSISRVYSIFSPSHLHLFPAYLICVSVLSTSQCTSAAVISRVPAGTPPLTNVLRHSLRMPAASPRSPQCCLPVPFPFPRTTSSSPVTRPRRNGGRR
jgi:hypothetical protein